MGDPMRKCENRVEREDDRVLVVQRCSGTIDMSRVNVVGLAVAVDQQLMMVVVVGLVDMLYGRQRKDGDAAHEHRRDERGRRHWSRS